MNKSFTSYLSSHDGQRSAMIGWPQDCLQAFDSGVACAQAWLNNDDTGWLWANLIIERDALPAALQRRAFEVGFLKTAQQKLTESHCLLDDTKHGFYCLFS